MTNPAIFLTLATESHAYKIVDERLFGQDSVSQGSEELYTANVNVWLFTNDRPL